MMCWILLSSQLGKLSVWRRWMPLSNRRQILLHSKPSHGQREHREKRTSCLMQGKWGRKHFSFISNTIPTFMKSNPSLLFHPCLFGYLCSPCRGLAGGTVLSVGEFLPSLCWEEHDSSVFFFLSLGICWGLFQYLTIPHLLQAQCETCCHFLVM